MTKAVLEVSQVTKSYPGGLPVLGPCDLRLEAGEVVAVVGPSGAGKTTLLQLMAGLLKPDSGSVVFAGSALRRPSPRISVVFQDYGLFPWRSTMRNVAFPLEVAGAPRRERRARSLAALTAVDLGDAADKFPHQLSGGMRQRAALARALVNEPSVLLLDEPTSALDIVTKRALQDQISDLVRTAGLTTMIVTHDLMDAVRMADRAVVLAGQPGLVVAEQAIDRAVPSMESVRSLARLVEEGIVASLDVDTARLPDADEQEWVLT